MNYIEEFKRLREQKGLKQSEVSELLGMSKASYGMYETQKRKMPIEVFAALCRYYHVSADDLLGLRP